MVSSQWAGGRATVGVAAGRFYFKVRLTQLAADVKLPDIPVGPLGSWRGPLSSAYVGLSYRSANTSLLGDDRGSWAYRSSGSAQGATDTPLFYHSLHLQHEVCHTEDFHAGGGQPKKYGFVFGPGDEIGCFLDRSDPELGIPHTHTSRTTTIRVTGLLRYNYIFS